MNSKLIVKAGLIAGALDIIAAFLNFYFKTGKNPTIVLKYIASAIFGKEAMTGGIEMIFTGLLLHFIIAFIFTLFFSLIYKKLWSWFQNTTLIAVLYGFFVWLVMNLAIVPLSRALEIPFSWSGAITNCIILITCIGLPLSYLFRKNNKAI
ncbi:hypothetical protein EZ428_06845 [Pedobacter frigiditerrae]|uniref:DUF1440 domain-containing protein n=1 Tax=Pedobacter frigiditerrae TaxID=2530452 RepID=A0A4R0N3P1_9SPHI|nr:hypothetical protein [Pedobacter frigiditerrae]TCC94481.1 hypothetical protein EZ428_06845 [Pedobacter frigiditerrae]